MIGIEVAFEGRIGSGPSLRQSQAGKLFCTMSVAVDGGKADEPPQWVSVIVFGDKAEAAGALLKGSRVYVEGKLSMSTYTRQNGVEQTDLKVTASLVQPLGQIGHRKPKQPKKPVGASDWQRPLDQGLEGMDQEIPF